MAQQTHIPQAPDGSPVSDADSNFFSRWSRRKAELREGSAVASPAALAARVPPAPAPAVAPGERAAVAAVPPAPAAQPAPPPPTLADVAALTTQSDYTRFVARDVAPEVQQAALKKLFTDPHFNIMDGLDTYIDDYGKPDPLPAGMLRKMMQSQLLGLFDHENQAEGADPSQGQADTPAPDGGIELPLPAEAVTPRLGGEPVAGHAASTIPNAHDK